MGRHVGAVLCVKAGDMTFGTNIGEPVVNDVDELADMETETTTSKSDDGELPQSDVEPVTTP